MSTISSSSSSSSDKWVIFSSSKPMQPMPFAMERRRWEEFDLYLLTNIVAATDSDSQQAQQEKTTFLYSFFWIFLFLMSLGKSGMVTQRTGGLEKKINRQRQLFPATLSLWLGCHSWDQAQGLFCMRAKRETLCQWNGVIKYQVEEPNQTWKKR